jgi:hypothetical protein
MAKPPNRTTSRTFTTGLVPIKCAARLNVSLDLHVIKVRLRPRCTNRNVIKNNPISDMMTFLVIDEYIINVLSGLFLVNIYYEK